MKRHRTIWSIVLVIALGIAAAVVMRRSPSPVIVSRPAITANSPSFQAPVIPPQAQPNASFQMRPFAVAQESDTLQWTAEDGKDANVIRRLAHNDLEYQRMVDENIRIIRRQLVYLKEPAAALIEQSKLTGQPVLQLTLPGLDGQEVPVEIERADLSPSGQQGTFTGHIFDRPDSMVTLAFKGRVEAFTVISPSDKLYLQGDPREPGEVLVKSFNPDEYITGVCGNP